MDDTDFHGEIQPDLTKTFQIAGNDQPLDSSCARKKFSPNSSDGYVGKTILAPMVRMGTLPFRLLCLRYGADLVYSEEIIDVKLSKCKRVVNDQAATIDFVDADGTVVFQTCAEERDHVIVQLGTSHPDRALAAATLVENDVFGIDVNMGCPKEFSLKGGMGAALLQKPQLAHEILATLVSNLKVPVSCKIRVLADSVEETVSFLTKMASAGIAAVAVHGRLVSERPQHRNRDEIIAQIVERMRIPVICSGGSSTIQCLADVKQFQQRTKASSVMLARCVQKNPSLFRAAGVLPKQQIISDFLSLAARYNLCYTVCKYAVQHMYGDVCADALGPKLLSARSLEEICSIFGKHDEYMHCMKRYWPSVVVSSNLPTCNVIPSHRHFPTKRPLSDDASDKNVTGYIIEMPFKYFCKQIASPQSPRVRLHMWILRNKYAHPTYRVRNVGSLFFAEVEVEGKQFTSTIGHKNKKQAEQAAAFVALSYFKADEPSEQQQDEAVENHNLDKHVAVSTAT